jgi:hypothetical protein
LSVPAQDAYHLGAFGTVVNTSTFPDPMYLADAAAMVLRDRNHPCIIGARVWAMAGGIDTGVRDPPTFNYPLV